MKKILYFILACITLFYIGVLCYANIVPDEPSWIYYIELYGGIVIALAYAAINFFGSPLKIVLFILLVVAAVVLVLTICIPEVFRDLFGIVA